MEIHYTYVSQFLTCNKREQFRREGAIGPLGAALAYGTILHYGLALAFKREPWRAPLQDAITGLFSGQQVPGLREQDNWDGTISFTDKDAPVEIMRDWIPEAIELYLVRFPQRAEAIELTLSREIAPGIVLTGTIDKLVGGKLVDYKLANTRYKPDKMQGGCYAILSGGPTCTEFHIVRKERAPSIDVVQCPEAEDQRYLDFLVNSVLVPAAEAMTLPRLPANDSHIFCDPRWCKYWQHCVGRRFS